MARLSTRPAASPATPPPLLAILVAAAALAGLLWMLVATLTDDIEAPVVSLPADLVVAANGRLGTAVVNYAVSATDNKDPSPNLLLTAGLAPGAAFPIGVTMVTWEAIDAAGNVGTATFSVTVETCPADSDCITVHTGGGEYLFTVEWAIEPAERTCGLMFREEMPAGHGMVFDFQEDRPGISFWMRNTLIPLDMIFIRAGGEVLNIAENTTPLSLDGVPAAGPVRYVLELNGGTAARIGLEPGDSIDLARAPGRTGGTAICFPPLN